MLLLGLCCAFISAYTVLRDRPKANFSKFTPIVSNWMALLLSRLGELLEVACNRAFGMQAGASNTPPLG